jgi:hypothetical protein
MADGWTGHLDVGPIRSETRSAAAEGLQQAAERVGERSDADVPVQTGRLRGSRRVSTDRQALEAVVSYDTSYAVEVHEDMSRHHPDGHAKYLEGAFNELRASLLDEVAAKIRQAWGS